MSGEPQEKTHSHTANLININCAAEKKKKASYERWCGMFFMTRKSESDLRGDAITGTCA